MTALADARRLAEEALARIERSRYDAMVSPYNTLTKAESALRALLSATADAPPAGDGVRECLAALGLAVLREWWGGDCCDIDGASVQEYAEEAGLWRQVERHADGVECEWCGNDGSGCGELTDAGSAAFDDAAKERP